MPLPSPSPEVFVSRSFSLHIHVCECGGVHRAMHVVRRQPPALVLAYTLFETEKLCHLPLYILSRLAHELLGIVLAASYLALNGDYRCRLLSQLYMDSNSGLLHQCSASALPTEFSPQSWYSNSNRDTIV